MQTLKDKIKDLPGKPGVYLFKDNLENIIYIGKAKNLKKRVDSHFAKPRIGGFDFISEITDLDYFQCSDEKEAMLLESELIKKLQPKYNIEWKDDKSFLFVQITDEKFPTASPIHQVRKSQITNGKSQTEYLGPFVKGKELKSFLKNTRKILPYRTCKTLPKKSCLYYQLDLCTAPCVRLRRVKEYQRLIDTLKVLLKLYNNADFRIECYDISNLSGTLATGSMVVFEKGKKKNKDYRMFKIKTVKGQNDVKSLKEILNRRLKHDEWQKPDLIILDGGKGQLKAAKNIPFPVLALAKSEKRLGKIFSPFSRQFIWVDQMPESVRNVFLSIRDEAHRFAIKYHHKRRLSYLKVKNHKHQASNHK